MDIVSQEEASGDDPMDQVDPNDEQVEVQLANLRNKLAEVSKNYIYRKAFHVVLVALYTFIHILVLCWLYFHLCFKAEKECAELIQELQELERKSTMNNQHIASVNEALQLYERSSAHDMFQGNKVFLLASRLVHILILLVCILSHLLDWSLEVVLCSKGDVTRKTLGD